MGTSLNKLTGHWFESSWGRTRERPFPYAPLAQLVEQLTLNQWVQGSSP